jgi:hypothetical protein
MEYISGEAEGREEESAQSTGFFGNSYEEMEDFNLRRMLLGRDKSRLFEAPTGMKTKFVSDGRGNHGRRKE